jgi:hypothetical protein
MERMMAPNGEVEWVSVEGREVWLERHKRMDQAPAFSSSAQSSSKRPVCVPVALVPGESWLAEKLGARGVSAELILMCESKLVVEEDFTTEEVFASLQPDEFNAAFLAGMGISAKGLQLKFVSFHKDLHVQYNPPSSCRHLSLRTRRVSARMKRQHFSRCKTPCSP